MDTVRVLLLADTHLGFDLPAQPRVARRRRGHDFLANYATALRPALNGEVDVVVHGGDVFNRSRVAPSLAFQAFEPLLRVAQRGVPVLVVPGNHERSRLPHSRLAAHPNVYIFDRARTFVLPVRALRVAFGGFPSERREVRTRFTALLAESALRESAADVRVLCMHQCVEGATVGPVDFTFTTAADVIRARDIPGGIAAVLSGHIHRHQVLTRDLRDRALAAPVLYPGSIERTSFAEMDEPKGYLRVRLTPNDMGGVAAWQFCALPARPMLLHELNADQLRPRALDAALRALIAAAPANAVVKVRLNGTPSGAQLRLLSAAQLRTFVPASMNVEVRAADGSDRVRGESRRRQAPARTTPARVSDANLQLEL